MNPAAHFMNLRYAAGLLGVPPPFDVGVDAWGSVAVILLLCDRARRRRRVLV